MTEPEDQLRAYAAAVTRAQQPIEIGELRTGRRSRRLLVGAFTALLAVGVSVGVVVVAHGRHNPTTLEVSPTSSSPSSSSSSTPTPPLDCRAAALTVTGERGEQLRAGWLPPGLRLTSGSETDLGAQGGPQYFTLGGKDPSFVLLSRFNSSEPLAQLIVAAGIGASRPVDVQGHAGLITNNGVGPAPTIAIGWTEVPGVELRVQAHGISEAEALKVAGSVQYSPAGPFTYPTHPDVTVSREQALSKLGSPAADAHAALTSFGEFTAVRSHDANHSSSIAPGVAVTEPVWVAWTSDGSKRVDQAIVVDAHTGETIATVPTIDSRAVDSLTDRNVPGCTPPFGVLTRSEATYLQPPAPRGTVTMKLTTLADVAAIPRFSFAGNCSSQACDPATPLWVIVFSAPDRRFFHPDLCECGPPSGGSTTTTTTTPAQAGSWSATAIDARTGPQDTSFGGASTSSPGTPPAALLALPDLSPQ